MVGTSSFPDFPGCVTQGDTAQQAMEHAIEALSLHVEGMVAEGLVLAAGSGGAAADGYPEDMPTQLTALLPVEVPAKTSRLNVTMEQTLLERLDAAARQEGATRSAYLAEAVREKLQRSRQLV